MQWWMDKSPSAANLDISWARYDPQDLVIDFEPIEMNADDKGDWIHACMQNIGFGDIFKSFTQEVQDF